MTISANFPDSLPNGFKLSRVFAQPNSGMQNWIDSKAYIKQIRSKNFYRTINIKSAIAVYVKPKN